MGSAHPIDARSLREQLSLVDHADVRSPEFIRFVVRLSEALDRDIPPEHYNQLRTLAGTMAYVQRLGIS